MRNETLKNKRKDYSKIIILVLAGIVVIWAIFKILTNQQVLFGPLAIPVATEARIFSETSLTDSNLTGFCSVHDEDFEEGNLSCEYIWYKNDSANSQGSGGCLNDGETNLAAIYPPNLQAGVWIFSCRAFDNYNYSEWKNSSSLSIESVPLISFSGAATKAGIFKQKEIHISVSATSENLDKIEVYLYDSTGLIFSNSSNETITATISNLSDGAYYLNASASDKNGHISYSETRAIILDNIAPNFTGLVDRAARYGQPIAYQISAEDSNGISCIKFKDEQNNTDFNLDCFGYLSNKTILPVGTYWVNVSVNDSANNLAFGSFYIAVSTQDDIYAPNITGINLSLASSSAKIDWITDELADSKVEYGNSSLSSNISSGEKVLSHSMTLSSLTSSTLYQYKITSCDASGNCKSYQSNFTTLVYTAPAQNDTYSVSYNSLLSGYSKTNFIKDDLIIIRLSSSGDKHYIKINSIDSDSVSLSIDSDSAVSFSEGDEKAFDLTGDGKIDIKITLNEVVSGNKADLSIKKYEIQASTTSSGTSANAGTTPNAGQTETPESNSEPDSNYLAYIIWALVVIIILAVAVVGFLKKKELLEFFNKIFQTKKPSESYLKIIELIKKAEYFLQQGQKDKALSFYSAIRTLFSSLSRQEKDSLKQRILKIYSLAGGQIRLVQNQQNSVDKKRDVAGGFYTARYEKR
jgi:hypothetical protein